MPMPTMTMGQNPAQEVLLQKAQQVWTMLDEMAESNPEVYKKYINKQMKEASQDMIDRNPSAEFCVKTWLYNENCFLFVEIFSWKLISAPRVNENQAQELPAHITDVEYQTKSTGNKKSARVMLVVNPEVIQKCPTNAHPSIEQRHLMQNILEMIGQQTGLSLKPDSFEFLDKTACKGDPVKLRHNVFNLSKQKSPPPAKQQEESVLERLTNIQLSEKSDDDGNENFVSPLVKLEDKTSGFLKTQETKESSKPVLIRELSNSKTYPIEPRYEIETNQENCVIVNIHLPGVKSGAECEVDLIEDVLTVEVGTRYSLLLPLDANIDDAKASADFSVKSAVLTIKVPLIQ